jgi:hypothetical protein
MIQDNGGYERTAGSWRRISIVPNRLVRERGIDAQLEVHGIAIGVPNSLPQ